MFSLTQNYLTRGFWGDEAWTSLISQLPYLDMLKTTAADFHPPGYYSLIEFLVKLSENFTKSASLGFILFSTLGIYTHYYMFFILVAQGIYLLLFDRNTLLKS